MDLTKKGFRIIFCKWCFCLFLLLSCIILMKPNTVVAQSKLNPLSRALRISTFDIDVTPPIGSPLAYNPEINKWDLGLRAKGVVLLGSGKPIVMCAIDWILISNEGMDAFKNALAVAAGTTPHRVAVHVLHQHDAPLYDAGAEQIFLEAGIDFDLNKPINYQGNFARETIRNLALAVRNSLSHAQPVTHLGLGQATVYKVASNRNIYGADGKVRATRYTTTKDAALRAEPEGVIDPVLSLVSFWNEDKPVAIISYYATHPQSYYGTGVANPDFPGIARFYRQLAVPDALHIHFNGAGGNIGAGKYNDGSHENRLILATRLADGMKRAWDATSRQPITAKDIDWIVEPVSLPPAKYLYKMQEDLSINDSLLLRNSDVARKMAWLKRCEAGRKLDIACLKIKNARILYMPGELFVEYQLAAKAERPDLFVAMAAYGDLGTGYVGTAEAYKKGGYEVSDLASNVAPEVEGVLMKAIRNVLQK
jgi:hypothetical protein